MAEDKSKVEPYTRALEILGEIKHYLNMMLTDQSYDPHVSTLNHLNKLKDLCDEALEVAKDQIADILSLYPDLSGKIVVSCDASITENPGGTAAIGVIIRFPSKHTPPFVISRITPATTNNQAEYDAVYEALNYFKSFGTGYDAESIEIRSDSQLVVNQLNGKWEVKDENLQHRHESVLETLEELEKNLGLPIKVVWYPRNSTDDLKQANYIAQDRLGVKNH